MGVMALDLDVLPHVSQRRPEASLYRFLIRGLRVGLPRFGLHAVGRLAHLNKYIQDVRPGIRRDKDRGH